jgi:hypothetical protein
MSKSQRHRITHRNDLHGQEWGIFSVNSMKAKLFSFWYHEALFSVLNNWKYDTNSPTTVVKYEELENSEVYKLGRFKWERQ